MLALLKDYYKNYTLFVPDPLFREDDYYVIRESGRVVAGIQKYPVTWNIVDFGSNIANGLANIITRLPRVKKRFNPDNFHLLAFDGIYCEKGYESALYELMEGVLERSNTYVAIIMSDTGSELYGIFQNRSKLGILHKILGNFLADIRVRFINLPGEIRQYFLDHPTYISTFDIS